MTQHHPILFLHVPHTCGRQLLFCPLEQVDDGTGTALRCFVRNVIWSVHNPRGFRMLPTTPVQLYFILRNPIDRIWGEYKHYSAELEKHQICNYLDLKGLQTAIPGYDHQKLSHYVSCELSRNLYCKFLLRRKDWSIPVSEDEYAKVVALFESTTPPRYDIFKTPMEVPVLEQLVQRRIRLQMPVASKTTTVSGLSAEDINLIQTNNTFDIRLYAFLLGKN